MRSAGHVLLGLALLRLVCVLCCGVIGGAVGLAAVAVHAWWWGLLLAAVASLASVVALPPRWFVLLPFALGWWPPVLAGMTARREGDYAVEGAMPGYLLLAVGAAVLVVAAFLVTLRWPARSAPGSAPRGAR